MANNKHDPYPDSEEIDFSTGFLPDNERMTTVTDRHTEMIKKDIHQRRIPDRTIPARSIEEVAREMSKGYHIGDIPKGIYGEPSKIKEETEEFMDAVAQGSELMALVELSDLYGAMRGYLKKYHPTIKMSDLEKMSKITRRAFKNGHRS